MQLYPAIDISDSKCVRLKQGDFDQRTIYFDNPIEAAIYWENQGATQLHIVDLDGSRDGEFINLDLLIQIKRCTNLKLQFGGGIRTMADVEALDQIGIDRIVIGSLALKNFELFEKIVKRFNDKIVCAVDFKNNDVMLEGWQKQSQLSLDEFINKISLIGCKTLLVTNISRDGMLTGPDIDTYIKLKEITDVDIIASGGVSSIEDLLELKEIGMPAVIIGKALYENKFSLNDAKKAIGGA